jgi:large subunit ribosomal protein L30
MKAIIRIKGQINVPERVDMAFNRIRLRRKFVCVVLKDTPDTLGVLRKLDSFVAYGDISKETFMKLVERRGQKIDKKKNIGNALEFCEGKKSLNELNLKPFFRMHPPRGGIDTKQYYPKGVLGDHKTNINKLIERML